jgi:hypothetical protein
MLRWMATLVAIAGCAATGTGGTDAVTVVDTGGVDAGAAPADVVAEVAGPASCEERPPPRPGTTMDVKLTPTLAGEEIRLGQAITVGGRRVKFSTLRFFVSNVVLLRAGVAVPADLVDRQQKTRPYGVQLVDLDDLESTILRMRAPEGRYDGIALGIGLPPACNGGNPAMRVFPLDADGGMTWIWALGYMFVRLEGTVTSGAVSVSFAAHGGVLPLDAGPVKLTAMGDLRADPALAQFMRARLDDLIEAATSGEHLSAGMAVMARLPTAGFLSIGGP